MMTIRIASFLRCYVQVAYERDNNVDDKPTYIILLNTLLYAGKIEIFINRIKLCKKIFTLYYHTVSKRISPRVRYCEIVIHISVIKRNSLAATSRDSFNE